MKKILALTFCAALGLRLCAQNTPAPMRLAIVSESTDTMAAADLLTAELSKNDRVQLLERSEIEKVIREQQLSLINLDCLKLGRLLGADGLLALQSVTEGTNVFLNAQLVAVRPGVILTDERFGRPAQDVSAWAANIVGHLEPLLPKLGVLARDAIPLSVVNFHAGVRTAEAAALERQIFYLTVERLVREPRLFVLERRRMQALSEEKEMSGAGAEPFWNGKYLLDGAIDRDGYSPDTVTLNARLIPPGGIPVLIEVSGSRTNFAEVVNQLAEKVLAGLRIDAKPSAWEAAAEAEKFFNEAQWCLGWGLRRQAQAAVESAWALGKHDEACAKLRIKSYLPDISAHLAGFNDCEHTFSPGYNADGKPLGAPPSDAAVQSDVEKMKAQHQFGIAYKFKEHNGAKIVEYDFPNGAPDADNINRACHSLELYLDYSRTAFPSESKSYAELQSSDWYSLGIEDLTLASEVLKEFNCATEERRAVAEKLSELRSIGRSVVEWISRSPSVHDGYFVGDRIVTSDELTPTLEEHPNIFRFKVNWGCFWQERPEETIAVYRDLMSSPVFCYVHKDFWNRDLMQPRLVAWNPDDQKHIPQVWTEFANELSASTNVLWQMEAKALAWAEAGGEAQAKSSYEDLLSLIRSNRTELVANKVELFHMNWGLDFNDAELRAMDAEYWQKTVRQTANAEPVPAHSAMGAADAGAYTNLSPFEAQKVFLKAKAPYEPQEFAKLFFFGFKNYSREQALEIKPLLAEYKKGLSGTWARVAEMQVGHVEANVEHILDPAASTPTSPNHVALANGNGASPPGGNVSPGRPPGLQPAQGAPPFGPPGFPPNRRAEPTPGPDTPAPEPLVSSNIITVRDFYPLPMEGTPGYHPHSFRFIDHQWIEGKLLLDFCYNAWVDSFDTNGNVEVSANKLFAGLATFDPDTRRWLVAMLPDAFGEPASFTAHEGFLWRGSLYSSHAGKIQRYDVHKQAWQPAGFGIEGGQFWNLDGRLYRTDFNSIQEITENGRATKVLASIQRQPPVSSLDSQGALMHLALFLDAQKNLCAAAHNQLFRWDGNDWHEIGTAATSFTPAVFEDGVLFFTDGFNVKPARISGFNPRSNTVETCLVSNAHEPVQLPYWPRRAAAEVVSKPLWKLPAELSLPNLSAACWQSDLFLMADHSEKKDVVDEQQHSIVGSEVIAKDGYNADLDCFTRDLPAAEKIRLRFDAAEASPPMFGIGSKTQPMIAESNPIRPWMLFTTHCIFCGREQSNAGMSGSSELTGFKPGIWAIPLDPIAAEVGALKKAQSDAVSRQKSKADFSHE